jgi:hypothetical protein
MKVIVLMSYDRELTRGPGAARFQYFIPAKTGLLGFFVRSVLTAAIAELRELEPAGGRLLVLRRRVITLLARGTLQSNYFTHTFILTDSRVLDSPEITCR